VKWYFDNMRKHVIETITFFSNSNGNEEKEERERSTCRAFLRTIGVAFEEKELLAPAPSGEPSDVDFRSARFQIREILDQNRKRGDEWKKKLKEYSEKKQAKEWLKPYSLSTSIELQELMPKIVQALLEKFNKPNYGAVVCSSIDALVYVNLKDQHLATHSNMPNLDELRSQGWRSVSLLFPPYGVILYADSMAPDFLCALEPGQYMKFEDISSLFDT